MNELPLISILYHPQDQQAWETLEENFSLLVRLKKLSLFDVHKSMIPGAKVEQGISTRIQESAYIICLISPTFMMECYHWLEDIEAQNRLGQTIPVKLKPVALFDDTPLGGLKTYPNEYEAISMAPLAEHDAIYTNIVNDVLSILELTR